MVLCGCPPKKPLPPPESSGRCEIDLAETGLFSQVGTGARAKVVETEKELTGGPFAQGEVGDFLIENDKVRLIVQRPTRHLSPIPYGGHVIDADRRRPVGEPGRDQLGKVGLLYAFGRLIRADRVEVLEDGSRGGAAVLAATGADAVNDYMNAPNMIDVYLPGVALAVDPNQSLPLRATTYFVLSPGESRLRMVTAFCNDGRDPVVIPLTDLVEQGGATEFFNPDGCSNAMGAEGCLVDPSSWFGYQGDGVAYAMRSYQFADLSAPQTANALAYVAGVAGTIVGGESQQALLSWVDPNAERRPGAFGILGGSQRNYLRDLFVARDLGEVTSNLVALGVGPRGRLNVTVSYPDGTPAAAARVAVVSALTSRQETLLVSGPDGKAKVDLPSGGYRLIAGIRGRALEPAFDVQVPTSGSAEASLKLGPSRKLTVAVKDPNGAPLSAKVRVGCPGGPCAWQSAAYAQLYQVEPLPSDVAAIGLVPPQGALELELPPAQYELFVTRGPEYSAWPDTFPARGDAVDLTSADQQRSATLAAVVDTNGWASADLHVHAVHSPDSSVPNDLRVLSFLAEGVDVLVSTDHDFITDFGPVVRSLGADGRIATMIGAEVTPFDFGHQNAFPLSWSPQLAGGAFDWAGGDGPTLRLDQLYSGLRERFPGVVLQMNHPRGKQGSLTQLRVDTASGASHADPASFRMEPPEGGTAADTRLLSEDFDALEVANGFAPSAAVLNDWMTFLSRGSLKTATAVSDTHAAYTTTGGYSRTYVEVGADSPSQLDPAAFAQAARAQKAIGTNGPFVRLSAVAVDANGQAVGAPVGIGGTAKVNVSAREKLELALDVQAPEWLTFDTIEVFTHASGREAVDGQANSDWPDSRVHRAVKLDPTALPVEPVPGVAGNYRRIHVVLKFLVAPQGDTWYSVIVRGSSQSASLAPLAWRGVGCSNGVCTPNSSRAYAFTNAVLVDGDGTGQYDNFPLQASRGLSAPIRRAAVPRRIPTPDELRDALREILSHRE
ncbi:MAG: PHP domain-containing protein [Myxococcales bacterium]|nr:PHP domain-containing protein [Myxococcales bacterium]